MTYFFVDYFFILRWFWNLLLFLRHSQTWSYYRWFWHSRRSHYILYYWFLYSMLNSFCLFLNSNFILNLSILTSFWRFNWSHTAHKMSKLALQFLKRARSFRIIKAPSTTTKVFSICLNKLYKVFKLLGWLWSHITLNSLKKAIVDSFHNVRWQLNVWILIR